MAGSICPNCGAPVVIVPTANRSVVVLDVATPIWCKEVCREEKPPVAFWAQLDPARAGMMVEHDLVCKKRS